MQIKPDWRILTIGDGDLSFSLALKRQHRVEKLVATTLDTESVIREKYQDHGVDELKRLNVPVEFGVDVTDPNSWSESLESNFDLVFFQFPLIPAVGSKQAYEGGLSINARNRRLLHLYLKHCYLHFLDSKGLGLACISSKDVKPYTQWNIETALHPNTSMRYLGKQSFDISAFPQYRIRNVDRDKHVKDTSAFSYFWGRSNSLVPTSLNLEPFQTISGEHCAICRAGPFATLPEKEGHLASKKHKTMVKFDEDWQDYLQSQYNDNYKREA